MNRNFSKELERILEDKSNYGKHLFLHSCCAPCSSYVLEYLRCFFRITVFYYNPNITEDAEYQKRVAEQKRLIEEMNRQTGQSRQTSSSCPFEIGVMEGEYRKEDFFAAVKGLEQLGEGSPRCFACFRLRLEETARKAREQQADFFTTTLTISPLKNAEKINEIGEEVSRLYEIPFLPSDFKKKDGYRRSIELSREYDLYRQDYCGCAFSRAERLRQKSEESEK